MKKRTIGIWLLTLGLSLIIGSFMIANRLEREYYYVPQKSMDMVTTLLFIGMICAVVGLVMWIGSKFTVDKGKLTGELLNHQADSYSGTKCPSCGLELARNVEVCPNCGVKMEHSDSVDIAQLVRQAENGGKRTVAAMRVTGDLVTIQEKINQYLQEQGYKRSQTVQGEQVWMNTLGRMIKYEFVPGYMILSGCLAANGEEMNLEGLISALWKKKVAKDMEEIGKLVK